MLEEVTSFELLPDYEIYVELSDGRKGIFDTTPYLDKGVFHELKEPSYFRRACLSLGTIAWPHEQDFAPETIAHDLKPMKGEAPPSTGKAA
ncbi:MAG: DUF2442 domain-containing protein [Deltaproteobacteria bacterium]|nr:DUF2442 domain-containing protein [Deltaproteobacteria bacterium]